MLFLDLVEIRPPVTVVSYEVVFYACPSVRSLVKT